MTRIAMMFAAALALAACADTAESGPTALDVPMTGDCSTANRIDYPEAGSMTCVWSCAAFRVPASGIQLARGDAGPTLFAMEPGAWDLSYTGSDADGWALAGVTRTAPCAP